ncbi:MAG: FKBP-type peptidyl-prolyl cis-trans isomerase N-terminal domain-containing protein [Pseudomonadota bacterium]
MKLRLLAAATLAALALTAGSASAQDTTSEKGKVSYALGYRAGIEIANVLASGEQLDMATVMKAFQDATGRKDPAVAGEQLGAALQALEGRIAAKNKAQLEKRAADNKTKGEAFLAQNRGKAGVKVLTPSGVQYRVVEAGSGARPTQENQITVEFRTLLPDGTEIENTNKAVNGQAPGPVTIRLSEIPLSGLREALQMMQNGARWEVVLPASAAHGTSIERAGPMANQVLIFDIKLLSVGPVLPPPQRPAAAPPRN